MRALEYAGTSGRDAMPRSYADEQRAYESQRPPHERPSWAQWPGWAAWAQHEWPAARQPTGTAAHDAYQPGNAARANAAAAGYDTGGPG